MDKVRHYYLQAKTFLAEVKSELKKVVWPQPRQAMSSTAVVIVLVAIVALFLALIDFFITKLLGLVMG
ncbi:MAG: preprotein translocase subunit SecE [Deltaproteobacteria bacterium]|nr:preprotein translocase subunit SecE [Deltaproteobacteria bacterium]